MERIKHAQKLGERFADPDDVELSVVVLFDGFVSDLERLHHSLIAHESATWEIVVIDNPGDDAASELIASLERVRHVPLRERIGYGAGRNLGLRQSAGRIVCIVDTSVALTGPVTPALVARFAEPDVGLVGRWGVTSDHGGFHFEESEGPDVDGVEGYFMALRRADVQRIGMFDPKFRFYRNADIDYSFQVRAAGLKTIVDPSLALERHTHRGWEETPEAERDELSRKNFFRFRDHWAERGDLFVTPQ